MVTLQNDLLEIYNNLQAFNKTTILVTDPNPIKVWWDREALGSPLVFSQDNLNVRLRIPIYYALGLEDLIKPSYLLPKDYDYLMKTLGSLINDSRTINDDRICLSPENYGFDIYATDLKKFNEGLERLGGVRFVSGTSWFFKLYTKWKYKLK